MSPRTRQQDEEQINRRGRWESRSAGAVRALMAGLVTERPQTDAGCGCVYFSNVRVSEREKANWELQNEEANYLDGKILFTVMGQLWRKG